MSCYIVERSILTQLKGLNTKEKIVKKASQIPNNLNKLFATVGDGVAIKLPSPPQHHLDYVSKCKSPLSSFLFEQVFPAEIRCEVLSSDMGPVVQNSIKLILG